jgi:hypothetical protein
VSDKEELAAVSGGSLSFLTLSRRLPSSTPDDDAVVVFCCGACKKAGAASTAAASNADDDDDDPPESALDKVERFTLSKFSGKTGLGGMRWSARRLLDEAGSCCCILKLVHSPRETLRRNNSKLLLRNESTLASVTKFF